MMIRERLPLNLDSLRHLADGRFADRFEQSLRLLWILHHLYGDELFPKNFGYTHVYRSLFSPRHPYTSPKELCQDLNCVCQYSLKVVLQKLPPADQEVLPKLLEKNESEWKNLLEKTRPFHQSRRTYNNDLNRLVELGWIEKRSNCDRRDPKKFRLFPEESWPRVELDSGSRPEKLVQFFDLLNDLAFLDARIPVLLEDLQERYAPSQEQRFFYRVDFIVNEELAEIVDDLQQQLSALWQKQPVLPVRFIYNTRTREDRLIITYPVCLFYARRAKYLSAYGQTPTGEIGWYHFRLDRMHDLKSLAWSSPQVPFELRQLYETEALPSPDQVTAGWEQAWGTDFYLPKALLILRFPADFAQRYVINTRRHESFQQIAYDKIPSLLLKAIPDPQERQKILTILQNRSREDAYFRAWVRVGDRDLTMRLRDWRPNGEVIAPLTIREQMRQEARQELQTYQD